MGGKNLVTMHKASLIGLSIRQAWALRHQTGVQLSAVEWISAMAVQSTVASAFQLDPTNHFRKAQHGKMLTSCTVTLKCQQISSFMPR